MSWWQAYKDEEKNKDWTSHLISQDKCFHLQSPLQWAALGFSGFSPPFYLSRKIRMTLIFSFQKLFIISWKVPGRSATKRSLSHQTFLHEKGLLPLLTRVPLNLWVTILTFSTFWSLSHGWSLQATTGRSKPALVAQPQPQPASALWCSLAIAPSHQLTVCKTWFHSFSLLFFIETYQKG